MAGDHQTSVIMGTLFHKSKVTEKAVVVKGFGSGLRRQKLSVKSK
jgi:hypothetical protein